MLTSSLQFYSKVYRVKSPRFVNARQRMIESLLLYRYDIVQVLILVCFGVLLNCNVSEAFYRVDCLSLTHCHSQKRTGSVSCAEASHK